jgi:hypothetical protein
LAASPFREFFPIGLFVFILSVLPHAAAAQERDADSLFFFNARIMERGINQPVRFAHVVNQTRGYASISDSSGYFRIVASKNDLLHITAIGYYDCPVHLDYSLLNSIGLATLYMIQRTYPIKAVDVNPLGTWNQFKSRFLSLEIPEPELVINPAVMEDIELGMDTIQSLEPASLGSPVTAIYMALSREGKEMKKYARVLEEEQFREQVKDKYNRELMEEVTGMTGPELHEFLQFCSLDRQFILKATAYEILESIHKCLEEYEKHK